MFTYYFGALKKVRVATQDKTRHLYDRHTCAMMLCVYVLPWSESAGKYIVCSTSILLWSSVITEPTEVTES